MTPWERTATVRVHGQERRAGLQRAVVAHVLEVERAEEERRVHPGDEQAADEAGVDEPARAEDAQRHDRMLDAGLEGDEGRHQHGRQRAHAEHVRRRASRGSSPRRSRRSRSASETVTSSEPSQSTRCSSPRPRSARMITRAAANVAMPIGEVDEEHPVPAQDLGEQAAGEQPERAAGDGDEHVRAHRPGTLRGLGELGDDDRQDHRRLGGGADALQQAGADQRALARGEAAQQRREREDDEAGEEDPPAPEEVAEAPGQEQQAAEGDEEGVDDPGEVRLAEAQIVLDRRQRDVHDRDVEDDHQLREADDDQRRPATAFIGRAVSGCGCELQNHFSLVACRCPR